MSLFWATFLTGILLATAGSLLLWKQKLIAPVLLAFPRSERAGLVTLSLGSVWFLAQILNLSEADFGAYRWPLFIGFGTVAVASWFLVREFIAVRGLAIIMLLTAQVLLTAAAGLYELPARLFLVTFVYLTILVALYLGASPYRLRDFLQWLFAAPRRSRTFGTLSAAYGVLLVLVAFTYRA